MPIIESYRKKLEELKEQKQKLLDLAPHLPDARYLTILVDTQIRDTESRLDKLTSVNASLQCFQCNGWISVEEEEKMVEVGDKKICQKCLRTISEVYTTQEAEELWGLSTGSIKQDCYRGKLQNYIDAGLIRKSGKYWLVHELVKEFYEGKK